MKNSIKILVLFVGILFGLNVKSRAQLSISVHIGNPPIWAPAQYAHRIRYYYIPEMDCYYDAQREGYYFFNQDSGDWYFTRNLPQEDSEYDFNSGPKVQIEYFGNRPFEYFRDRRIDYFNRYHPEGRMDFYGRYERGLGHHSGWENRWNGDFKNGQDKKDRKEWKNERKWDKKNGDQRGWDNNGDGDKKNWDRGKDKDNRD